jgi:cell division protein ZapA
MSESHRVDIEVLGQRLTVRSGALPEQVRDLAAYVEGRAREIRGDAVGQDPLKLLILAALDITDELFRAREDQARAEGQTTARVRALLELLDSAVGGSHSA